MHFFSQSFLILGRAWFIYIYVKACYLANIKNCVRNKNDNKYIRVGFQVSQYLFSYPLGICMFGVSFLVSKSFFHQISGIFVQELDQTKNMLPFKNQACKQSLPIHLFLKHFSSIPLNVVGF